MVRSIWLRTVAALLASTGLVWGQQSMAPPMAPAHPGERIITVQEMDQPALSCRVIRTWHTGNGAQAYQVQALDTGELLTVVESAPLPQQPGTHVRAVATTIYHWGRTGQPPAGTPMPPPDGASAIMPARATDVEAPYGPPSATGVSGRAWPPAFTDQPAPMTSGVAPMPPSAAVPSPRMVPQPAGAPACECAPCAPQPCECPSCPPQAVEMTEQVMTPRDGTGHRTRFASIKSLLAPQKQTVTMTATAGPAPSAQAVEPVATERAQPGDWRQSWGKPDMPLPPRSEYAQADVPGAPPPTSVRQARTDTAADPLRDPEAYSRSPQADGSVPGRQPFPEPPPSPAAAAQDPRVPPGMQSVLQAGVPPDVPAPPVTAADHRRPSDPKGPQSPASNTIDMSNAFTQPGPNNVAPMMPQAANAFTPAPPTGPTPDSSGAFPAAPGAYPPGFDPHMYGNPMGRGMPYGPMGTPGYLPAAAAPVGQSIRPVGYTVPAPAGAVASRPASAADGLLPRPGTLAAPEAVGMLRESMYPSQREWAALKLGSLEWRANPEAVLALVMAAREDPAPSVRAACIRSLAQMRVNTMPVLSVIQALKHDGDPRVQRAAEEALSILAPDAAAAPAPPGQPVSGLVPAKSN